MLGEFEDAIKAMMNALKKADPAAFREIITKIEPDPFDSLQISHHLLGEILISLEERMSIVNMKELGFLIVGQANLAKLWQGFQRDVADEIELEESERSENRKRKEKKSKKK
jgi:hypothetical protein